MPLCTVEYGPKSLPEKQRITTYHTCPANIIQPEHFKWLSLYAGYKDGFLWRDGGLGAQPAKYIQAMRIIAAEVNKIDEAKMEESKKK